MRNLDVLILGGGDVGSAVAHLLFRRAMRVLISERMRSPHARRGMAFTDALFDGVSTLDGVAARCVADMSAVEQCWATGEAIPMTTLAEDAVLGVHGFGVIVDATMKRNREPEDLRAMAGFGVGLGPGYTPGINCTVAIETQWGPAMGQVLRDRATAARSGGPRALDGVTRERFAIAPGAGLWRTAAHLGQQVQGGEAVGVLGEHVVCAPIAGRLRGLVRDGVEVLSGQRMLEVDPRLEPQIVGLGERPLAIANGVVTALELEFSSRVGPQ